MSNCPGDCSRRRFVASRLAASVSAFLLACGDGNIGGVTGAGAAALIAPSQFSAAVAGVQLASRQHSSLLPFFQVSPKGFCQLSTDLPWANAIIGARTAADANSTATLLSFFMILLSRKAAVACECAIPKQDTPATTL